MIRRLGRGDWSPGRTHTTLLSIQLVALWAAGLRGLDYVDGTVGGLDHLAADSAYGWLLYGSTIVVLVGLAFRRGAPVILGHALLASWYAGLGWAALADAGVRLNADLAAGIVVSVLGVAALLRGSSWPHRLAGVAGMLAGQYLLVRGLPGDYRAGTGLLSAGLLHGTLAVGTFILWQRQRLRRVVEDDRAP